MGDADQDFSSLSLSDKLEHKVWKARVMGYEEAKKLFARIDDEKSGEYNKFVGMIKKFVTDSNAVAQDKGLDAALSFVENAAVATRVASDVVEGVVLKCLNQKPKTKDKGFQICLMFVEIERAEIVQEEVMKGFSNKQPKVVAACIELLTLALHEFGPKVMNVKLLMKALPSLFGHSDKNVRAQGKALAVELYRWLRDAVKSAVSSLKPVQVKELEDEWAKLSTDPARPTRLLRSQQAKAAAAPAVAAAADDGAAACAAEPVEAIDPYDLLEAVNILEKLPSNFFESVVEPKWSDRKNALDALLELVSSPKLEGGNFGELCSVLKQRITKDTNVMVVAVAAKCVAGLATGLRKKFSNYVGGMFLPCLEKFKEKKANVVAALREAVDAMVLTAPVQSLMEDILACLENKNPSIRAETLLFLARTFCKSSPATVPKPMLKQLCPVLIKKFDDTTPQVRDGAAQCLGTLLKLMGERPMNAYLEDLDKARTTKVQEFAEKAEITPVPGLGGGAAAPAASKPASKPPAATPTESGTTGGDSEAKPAKKRPVLSSEHKKAAKAAEGESGEEKAEAKPAAKPPVSHAPPKKPPAKAASSAAKPAGKTSGGAKPAAGKGKGGGGPFKEPEGPPEPSLTAEEVDEKAAATFPAELLQQLTSTNWKERLAGYGELETLVKEMDTVPTYLIVKVMAKKPGWKDTNFQVIKAKFGLVKYLAENTPFGKKSAACAFPGLVDKLGDIKNKTASAEALSSISEALSLNYVSLQISTLAQEHKSPRVQQEALTWLSGGLREFGLQINIKPHVDYIKSCLTHTNPGVRAAAISLLGTIHLFLGGQLRMFFEDEKPALLSLIDAEFEKVKDEPRPTPTRGPAAGQEESAAGGGGDGAGLSLGDLMPRNDISGQIKPELIKELSDKQWKVREEALNKVSEIITAAKFITPALGELPSALKGRLSDSNKNLVISTLNILGSISTAMGAAVEKHAKGLVPGIIAVLADAKTHVRQAAVNCLNLWCQEVHLNLFVEGGYVANGLSTENPNLRTELLGWFEQQLSAAGAVPNDVRDCVPPLYRCLEDRSADVRKKAQAVVPALMAHIGFDVMAKAAAKLKTSSSKQAVMTVLEKHRGSVPAAPAASKDAPAKSAASKSSAPAKSAAGSGGPSTASKAKPPASSSRARPAGAAASEEEGPALTSYNGKESRMKADRDMKVLKWNFPTPRDEHIEQLREQLTPCVSKKLLTEMFHADFKHHIVALDMLTKCVTPGADGVAPQQSEAIASLDLLLRWLTLRFFDTNTSVLLKGLDFLMALFKLLSQQDYHLTDYEATSFLPYLVLKVGDAKEPVRKAVRGLFQSVCDVFPASKMFVYIVDGVKSKNARQRIECLEEIGCLMERHTVNVCQPSVPKAITNLATNISDRDNSVRSAALNALVVAYVQLGESVFFKHIGSISEKDRSLLEERIKRSGKKPLVSAETSQPSTGQAAHVARATNGPTATTEKRGLKPPQPRPPAPASVSSTANSSSSDVTVAGNGASVASSANAGASNGGSAKMSYVVQGEFSIDLDTADLTVDASVVPPVQLAVLEGYDALIKPFTLPQQLTERLGTRLASASPTRGDSYSSTSHSSTIPRPHAIRSIAQPSSSSSTSSASESLSRPVTSSTPTSLDTLLQNVANTNTSKAVQALKELEVQLQHKEVTQSLSPQVDELLLALAQQLQTVCVHHSLTIGTGSPEQLLRLLKYILHIQVMILQQPSLAASVSRRGLSQLLWQLLGALKDNNLLGLPDIAQLHRTINILFVRYFEAVRPNESLGAAVELLGECVNEGSGKEHLTELVLKCLWRLTRMLPQLLEQCQLDRLLLDLHHFLLQHPAQSWRQKSSNLPLRTIKTIIHHLAEQKGAPLMQHLTLIENAADSELVTYLRRTLGDVPIGVTAGVDSKPATLANQSGLKESGVQPLAMAQESPSAGASPSLRRQSALPSNTRQRLADIFTKIGERENTKKGLEELYDFTLQHPEANLDPYFEVCSSSFRGYVEKALQNIEHNRAREASARSLSAPSSQVSSDALMKRLEALRTKAGWQTREPESTTEADKVILEPVSSAPAAVTSTGKCTQAQLSDLQKRLDSIKASANT